MGRNHPARRFLFGRSMPLSDAARRANVATETGKADDVIARELLKFTLESLRNDTTVSRDMQQRVVQAFAAVFSSVLLGGLVYASQTAIQPSPVVLFVLFNLTSPVFAIVATTMYLGELLRQGRAAAAMRGLEKWAMGSEATWLPGPRDGHVRTLFLETYYGQRSPSDRISSGYGVSLYYGAILLLYSGALTISSVIGDVLLWRFEMPRCHVLRVWPSVGILLSALTFAGWVWTTAVQAREIQRLARTAPRFPDQQGFGQAPSPETLQ